MGKRPFVIGSVLLSTLLLACSSSGSGGPTTTGTPTDLAANLAGAFCAAQAACCSPTGAPAADGGTGACGGDAGVTGSATSTCLARATLTAQEQLALVATAFSEGLLTIDPTVESTCTTVYQSSLVCSTLGSEPNVQAALDQPACAGLFVGYIPVGERCDMSAECTSGSFCLSQGTGQPATSIAGSGTLGVCFAYQQVGDPCNVTDDCAPPLACNPTTLLCQ
ncbi:MAG TPA: hypothetical protein VI456_16430 [Polyangia bacterium]